jgi:hypothetical protein
MSQYQDFEYSDPEGYSDDFEEYNQRESEDYGDYISECWWDEENWY